MCQVFLDTPTGRKSMREYLQSFMVRNKNKKIMLVHCSLKERYLLIVLYPKVCQAFYLESSRNTRPEDYTEIKKVLNDALIWFSLSGGVITKTKCSLRNLVFGHKTDFHCVKQADNNQMSVYYALLQMREYIKD